MRNLHSTAENNHQLDLAKEMGVGLLISQPHLEFVEKMLV